MPGALDGLPELEDFAPFPIYDVETGLYSARQPWLAPHVASRTLLNGHSFRGRISKRGGYVPLAPLGTWHQETEAGSSGQASWLASLDHEPLPPEPAPSTYTIRLTDGTSSWLVEPTSLGNQGAGIYDVVDDPGGTVRGAWSVDLPLALTIMPAAPFAGDLVLTYEYQRGLTVMGIASFFLPDGTEHLVACDTRRLFHWSAGESRFYDRIQSDSFSGTDRAHFWYMPFEGALWMTNGTDPVKKYDPGTFSLTDAGTAWTGGGNQLTTCSMIFRDKGRLLYLDTTEVVGGRRGTRLRVTPVNDVEYGQAAANPKVAEYYADAPVNDTIVTAGWLGKELVVPCARTAQRLVYTGEPTRPYAWERIPHAGGNPGTPGGGAHGALARMGTLSFGELLLYRGRTGILATDGVGIYPFDTAIPDFALTWNHDATEYTYALLWDEGRRCLWQFADQDESLPGHALVMQFDDSHNVLAGQGKLRNWGLYELPFHCYGYTRRQSPLVLDDLTAPTLDEFLIPFDAASATAGFPLILAGGRDGVVYILGEGASDDGAAILFRWSSTDLNPYVNPKRGRWNRAHLGLVALLVSSWPDAELTVRLYADQSATPWKTYTVARDAVTAGQETVLLLRSVNRVATWHRIEVESEDAFPLHIDAVIPYFAPEGSARRIH